MENKIVALALLLIILIVWQFNFRLDRIELPSLALALSVLFLVVLGIFASRILKSGEWQYQDQELKYRIAEKRSMLNQGRMHLIREINKQLHSLPQNSAKYYYLVEELASVTRLVHNHFKSDKN